MSQPSRTYTIAELVALTGVPPATVHYYLRHGLLPQPRRLAPNRFAYDDRHVHALRLVRSLRRERDLPLPLIRRIMPELLRLEGEEAFRPEMWDRALAPRLSRRRGPSARLLEAAKEAFARRGYAEVNVDDLCRAARIAKGSFYRHYRSKEELLLAAAESLAQDLRAQLAERLPPEATAGRAAAELAELLEPALPVFLELFARAVQGRPGYRESVARVFGAVAGAVGTATAGEGTPEERGRSVLGAALSLILSRVTAAGAASLPPRAAAEDALRLFPGG
ncbi:MAG TPA: MerR family transcriptional regulator [Actinomycetota bacterium]|nr:MerR family transcriptional regulator [Actinomycetota bacterium]